MKKTKRQNDESRTHDRLVQNHMLSGLTLEESLLKVGSELPAVMARKRGR
jgi:hypothetical protein